MAKNEPKRLYRSQKDKVIAGVCGGIGEYFNVDPVWIRLIAVLLIFVNGTGILVYILAWILIPKNTDQTETKMTRAEKVAERVVWQASRVNSKIKKGNGNAAIIFGLILVGIGILLLIKNLFSWFTDKFFWPSLIIILGIFILMRRSK